MSSILLVDKNLYKQETYVAHFHNKKNPRLLKREKLLFQGCSNGKSSWIFPRMKKRRLSESFIKSLEFDSML